MSYWEECMYDWHGGPDNNDPEPELDFIEVAVDIVHETDKAVLFQHKAGKFWCPKAALISRQTGYVQIARWFKPKKLEE